MKAPKPWGWGPVALLWCAATLAHCSSDSDPPGTPTAGTGGAGGSVVAGGTGGGGGTGASAGAGAGADAGLDAGNDADSSTGGGSSMAYGPYTGSYLGKEHTMFGAACDTIEELLYYAPCDVDNGGCTDSYPVLFWVQGTCMPHDAQVVHEVLQEAARHGFVAVSPQYYNGGHDGPSGGIADPDWCDTHGDTDFCSCASSAIPYICGVASVAQAKAACIFDDGSSESATGQICQLPFADCAAMVAAGASQGASLAVRGAQWGPLAVAAYALTLRGGTLEHDSRTWLADDNLLEVHGANDIVCPPPIGQGFIEFLSLKLFDGASTPELDCTSQCTEPAGSNLPSCDCRVSAPPRYGYHLVGADQVVDGDPDHAFLCHEHHAEQYKGECDSLDPGFLNGGDPSTEQAWSWPAALEFLMARATE